MKRPLILLILAILLVSVLVFNPEEGLINVTLEEGEVIKATVADTVDERAEGLMFVDSMNDDEGMLFVYDDEKLRSFWMKNTLIPLDMIFLDSENVVVDIATMQPCSRDPCPTHTSIAPAMYVLEVNAGTSNGLISVGDKLLFK